MSRVDAATTTLGPVRRGVADATPIVLGYLPFGLVLGATIARSWRWRTIPATLAAGLAVYGLTGWLG